MLNARASAWHEEPPGRTGRRGLARKSLALGEAGLLLALATAAFGRSHHRPRRLDLIKLPANELPRALPELRNLRPASDQHRLPALLAKVGANVSTFFRTFPDVVADETVHEERTAAGGPEQALTQSFWYLALAQPGQEFGDLKEYRTDDSGRPVKLRGLSRGFMLTTGFISTSLVFAPEFAGESCFRYLGVEKLRRTETDVVAFAQRPSARNVESIFVNGRSVPLPLQGVAWIDPASDQIVRLRTDLLHPIREIELDRQTTVIRYAPKSFKQVSAPLWLPRMVIVTVRMGLFTYRNVHLYSKQRLFHAHSREIN